MNHSSIIQSNTFSQILEPWHLCAHWEHQFFPEYLSKVYCLEKYSASTCYDQPLVQP